MRKTIVFALILFLAAGIAGAGEKKKISANVASVYAAEGNIHEGMMKFKELIEAKTKGRISIAVHPAGALGAERDVLESLANGTVEMGATGGLDITLFVPEYVVVEEMFVFKDPKHMQKFWDTIGKEALKALEEKKGIISVGNVPRGSRWITSNKPIRTPADMKGLKIRLPDNKNRSAYFQAVGSIPSIVAFPELYMALKTGVVDAQENPPETHCCPI